MSAGNDTVGCGGLRDVLLPARVVEHALVGAVDFVTIHLEACSECRAELQRREAVADALRALPRLAVSAERASVLTFSAIAERLDEARLDARLATEASTIRRWIADLLPRLRAPARLWLRVVDSRQELRLDLQRAESSEGAVPSRRSALRRVGSLAAALLVAAAAGSFQVNRSGHPSRGFAAETALLDQRPPIVITLFRPDARGANRGDAHALEPLLLPRRGP